ncbi:VanZ family protein [Pseudonocardia endophytica]|uniref:VanZ like protein n=1 Tax=Pseudonocardia endophytica TaxID=401976 RepID=A0A4V2PIK8_PSEEN|nr:VanZ family protein [Pseudonocardia endophytica]TCK24966.1 VanZ like protein [Pseudonocardia endophytica]
MRSVPFAVAVLLSLVVLFTPESGVPTAPAGTDKVVHLLLFALLAFTGRRAGMHWAALLAGLVAYAGVSEVLQATLPIGRDGDLGDALTDVTGAAFGLAAFALVAIRNRTRS